MNNNLNDIKELIEKSKSFVSKDADLFTNIFANLIIKQEELYQNLEETVKQDLFLKPIIAEKIFVTCNLNNEDRKKELEGYSFTPMIEIDANRIVFIDCNYEELINYLNTEFTVEIKLNDGTKENKTCKLYKYDGYIDAEKIIANTFIQNRIKCPYIYSPLSRKAFEIIFDDDVNFENINNIKFEDEQIITGSNLYWNIKFEEKEKLAQLKKEVEPHNENVYQIVSFKLEDNEYICIKNENCDIKRIKYKAYINIDKENYDINDIDYCKVTISIISKNTLDKFKDNSKPIYENFYNAELDIKTRILTESDLNYVVSKFNEFGVNLVSISTKLNNQDKIKVYDRDDRYIYSKNSINSSSILYLYFEKSDDIYFNDKVSYIISYLNYHYPEYVYVAKVKLEEN